MNTLSRAITARFFPNVESYEALRRQWSAVVQSERSERKHELTAAHHLLYLVLRGKDWRKAFTPLTNRRKLDNGAFVAWGLFRALGTLQFGRDVESLLAPFGGLVTPEMLAQVRAVLPQEVNAYHYRPEAFALGAFPFDAYAVKQEQPNA